MDIRTFFVHNAPKNGERGRIFLSTLFHENEIDREYQTDGGGKVIPLQRFVVKGYRGKEREYGERDNLLYDFELDERERTAVSAKTDAVGGHLKTVLEKGDAPTEQNDRPQRPIFKKLELSQFQMSVPRECHKYIRYNQQQYGINSLHNA